jgi:transposase
LVDAICMDLRLSSTERNNLRAMVRRQRGEARLYRRARTILLAAEGQSVSAVARAMGTCRSRVVEWVRRFRVHRLKGLTDLPRSGRPVEITPLERHQVIAAACRSPADFRVQRDIWDHATLAGALMSAGLVRSISPRSVGRILQAAEIKPHHVKMWCHSDDPDYQQKMRAIVALYVHRPKGQPVLSIDEKTGMQALSHRRPLKPAGPGRRPRQEFEYKRNGTRCLFACFNVGTGRVLGRCTTTRTREDFLSFMDQVASTYRQRRVHVILDNLNTHRDTNRGDYMTQWNQRHGGRFLFHYTPTHGSWLNQVELWFCVLSRRILRYGEFHSPDELVAAIERFIRQWNQTDAHPFRWTYDGLPLVR